VIGMGSTDSERVTPEQLAREAADAVARSTGLDHFDIALVLGSGWGTAADLIGPTIATVNADQVPGFRPSSIPGHVGTLRALKSEATGATVLVLGARSHYYEHRDANQVAHPVRMAAALGVKTLVLTNGCGGVRSDLGPGTVTLINDHINLTAATPLEGATFVDLTEAYSPRLRELVLAEFPGTPQGVYAQFTGPQYETPAEVRMAARMGADLVGMSTALETIAARAAGLEVLALSLVTNFAAGITGQVLSHGEVLEAGADAASRIGPMLARLVERIADLDKEED
jgi:purine-nucleoside phosphorylase